MSKNEKAIAVAKDVIAQLKRIDIPLHVQRENGYIVAPLSVIPEEACDLQAIVDNVQGSCRVCALGATVLSAARLFDQIPAMDVLRPGHRGEGGLQVLSDREDMFDALVRTGVFDDEECALIEAAFEKTWAWNKEASDEKIGRAMSFGKGFESDSDCLIAIMENVIANDGHFVP